ncbi:MAG: TIGR03617 family F420-dependent LLM class oxidoreductase [Chloroflexota bacterium]
MKIDVMLLNNDLSTMAEYVQAAETLGFDGLWTAETNHDPFFPLVVATEHSHQIQLGTAIAVTFPRAPGTLAQIGWDLAKYSKGRFILGLGSQVRAHNERRFGATWDKPVRQMRESIEAIRAIWHSYQTGERLQYEGEYFKLSLMTPFFNAGPIEYPNVPIYISAVNKLMLRLAGSHCNGVHLHAINTVRYLAEYAWPQIEAGMQKGGRSRSEFQAAAGVFVIPTDAQESAKIEAYVRQQISFYLSTPAYRIVTELHGWEEVGFRLSKMARRGEWQEMPTLISDEMMSEFVVSEKWSKLPGKLREKYGTLLDRVSYYLPYTLGEEDEGWRETVLGMKGLF